nr:hypothetical protein [Vibrio parahaemolyticus]
DFTIFDPKKIGSFSLRYGWGIYFSFEKDRARMHQRKVEHIFKLPIAALEGKTFIYLHEGIKSQKDHKIQDLAISIYGRVEYCNPDFDVNGHQFYKDIVSRYPTEEDAVKYILQSGITGAVVKELSETIVLLYDLSLWKLVDKVSFS